MISSPQTTSRPFPLADLPGPVGRYIAEAAKAIGCDSSFVGLPLLACLARAIGNRRVIQLKDSWQEPAIIWGANVGKSGSHKSPALSVATAELHRRQSAAMAEHVEAMAQYERDRVIYERDSSAWKRSKTLEPPPEPPAEPPCKRYIVSDITIEALADRLSGQSDGVLVVRDELAGWLDGLAEYKGGRGSDTGHWLACWAGGPMIVDRKTATKKTVHIPRAAVSIVGGIQPGILRRAIGHEHLQDGLCARLLLTMPPQRPIRWTDATVSPTTQAALGKVFDRLLTLETETDDNGRPKPLAMPLTPEAEAAWIAFFNRHRAEMADLDDDLSAAWSKLEAYAARLALIIQLCDWAAGEASDKSVDEVAIEAGVTLAEWFADEARRVYDVLSDDAEQSEQRGLVEWIERQGGRVAERDLRHGPRRYRIGDAAEQALSELVKAGVGHWRPIPPGERGGRACRVFVLGDSGDGSDSETPPANPNGHPSAIATGNGHDADVINRMLAEAADD